MIPSMLWAASVVVHALYFGLPAASVFLAVRGRGRSRSFVAGVWLGGVTLAALLVCTYAVLTGGQPRPLNALLTLYLGVGFILWLRVVDVGFRWAWSRVLRRLGGGIVARGLLGGVRVVIFAAVALPWVMSAVMVYRPKVLAGDTPASVLGLAYEDVAFPAADGVGIAGWYVPASDADTTALLCHGLGSGRAGWMSLIRRLHQAGVNVLAIDLRAHGASDGAVCTYGLSEQADVRGAVAWLKAARHDGARRVVGVGASLGGAALLMAAADEPRLDAVAVLGTYATLGGELEDVARRQMLPPFGFLARHLGLPLASLHAGVDLRDARPADAVARLWPRPVLVVHATGDEVIPFDEGRRLYDAAPIGRQSLWVHGGSHNGLLEDPDVLDRVTQFVRSAGPVPLV
jgi:uncharacterized protein